MIKISDFLIHFNKYSETKFYIKKFNLKFIKINKTENFYMGYLSSKNSLKGEFLNIEKNKKNITLKNDQFGTYPVYYIKENNEIYISNSIKLINDKLKNITINKDKIYEYFSWGYLPCTKETIYKNVYSLNPNEEIKITGNKFKIINKKKKIFFIKKNINFSSSGFFKLFQKEINKMNFLFKKKISYIGLTSGNDSLLGSLILNSTHFKFITATFGDKKSLEIKKANIRSKNIFDKKNINIYPKKIFPKNKEIIQITNMLGGLSTFACFPQYKFHNLIQKKYKKKNFLDFSLFEFMRKKILNNHDLIKKYTTPKSVVNNYFKDKKKYNNSIKLSVFRMKKNYGKDYISYFYLYDRAVKNQFYKSIFLNSQNMTKIALMHNQKILNYNYNYLHQNKKFPFWEIFERINFDHKFKKKEKSDLTNGLNKSYPFDYSNFCLQNKKFFINILSNEIGGNFENYFNIKKIINNLKKNSIPFQHEWFYLRLINLLIFKYINKINLE